MKTESELVTQALEKTNAHALARLVNEKRVYTRVLWLLAWLVCCGLFIRQLVGFINRLQANDVTTNLKVDAVPFEYPDLFFCFDNPMSGSRHLEVSEEFKTMVNETIRKADAAAISWCSQLPSDDCESIFEDEAELRLNSMPYRSLVDEMGHTLEQSVIHALLARSNGLDYFQMEIESKSFYHPKHLRCFNISLNETQRDIMRFTGPDDIFFIRAMMDAQDNRMGRPILPVISSAYGNVTAPFWALDRVSLASKVRSSNMRVYITRPGHYPSEFDEILLLESGRSYNIELEMQEQVHTEDPTQCIESHPRVQMVNPYDNSAYSVAYDYVHCYHKAMQAQFKRVLNISLGYQPQPWPPDDRLLFNLSSSWGSTHDISNYLKNKMELSFEEPLERCSKSRLCTERSYTSRTRSTEWPVDSIIEEVEGILIFPQSLSRRSSTALKYLERISANKSYSQELRDYLRANLLQLEISIKKPMADRITFTRAYSFESFVADVGGILGIYLGMSVLTACELIQFLHDLILLCFNKSEKNEESPRHDFKDKEIDKGVPNVVTVSEM